MRAIIWFIPVVLLVLALTSCSSDEWSDALAAAILNDGIKQVDGEQVTVTQYQVECGVREDLWTMEPRGADRAVARLLPKARELGFADDIQIGELRQPYAMVRGMFMLRVDKVVSTHDQNPTTKIAEVKLGIMVNHSCFPDPLPMMGIHHGNFDVDTPARLQFASNGNWTYDRILH